MTPQLIRNSLTPRINGKAAGLERTRLAEMILLFNQRKSLARRQRQHARARALPGGDTSAWEFSWNLNARNFDRAFVAQKQGAAISNRRF